MNKTHFRKLEHMYLIGPCNEYYAPTIEVMKGEAEIVIAVDKKFFHAAGAVNGSVYFKALDDSSFFAVSSLVEDFFVLTASYNIYLLRPVRSGTMTARGKVVSATATLFVAESVLTDSDGREIARGSGLFVKSKIPLSSSLGYCER